ncbi:MAG: DUF302 domain-containing protein [Lentimicrobium sp.]|nr:DUF302 domain-containing protein [Lentimicrobium sp.]
MKIKILFAGLLVSISLMTFAQSQKIENKEVMIENQSQYNFDETVDILSKQIVEHGWKITATHDLQETMKKNGKEVLSVKVIELCNPGHAFNILSKDDLLNVSPMLPCRISVYEKTDGKTYISRMNAPAFAEMIGGDGAYTMVAAFNETEELLLKVILE